MGLVASIVTAAAVVYACGDDDAAPKVETETDAGKDASPPVEDAPADVKAPEPVKDAEPEAAAPPFKCADAGASVVDGSACKVSFKTDILPLLDACKSCHGTGANKPTIVTTDSDGTWRALAEFTSKVNRPLVNPCSKSVADSVLVQTIDPTVPPAERGSLMPPSSGLPAAVPKVKEWVECGAPNN